MKILSLLVAACACAVGVLGDHLEGHGERKDPPTPVQDKSPWNPVNVPKWATSVPPEKIEKLEKDMRSLAQSVRNNKMFTSMTAVMATAVPETFKAAMSTNPESLHQQFATATPDWYRAIPADVRKFMEDNKKAAKSIYSKDIGPLPSLNPKPHATKAGENKPKETGKDAKDAKDKDGKTGGKGGKNGEKSEASSLSIVGATSVALVASFGFALLML